MAIELHNLHPGHDDELTRLKARITELETLNHPKGHLFSKGAILEWLKRRSKKIKNVRKQKQTR